jgi:NhaA family Na+:H+ antiporter
MSLFIGSLAFAQQGVEYQLSVKVGVLMGSILSAVPGSFILTHSKPNEAYCLAGAKA